MKVRPQYFMYENLPCVHCKDKLMAASGMQMSPGPRIPGLKRSSFDYYDPSEYEMSDRVNRGVRQVQGPLPIGTPPDTSIIPGPPPPEQTYQQQPRGQGPNFGQAALLGLSAFDALLPNPYSRQQVVQPQMAYNPNPYGLGSQGLMENGGVMPIANYGYVMGEDENNSPSAKNGNWIQKAVNPAHKGYCTPMTKSTCTPRRKALAKTFKKHHGFHKSEDGGKYGPGNWNETNFNDPMSMITADMDIGGFIAPGWDQYKTGGIIPDNMSNFNPHKYAQGGNVNGGAKIKEVGANYPNADLFEQWLLYANGGNVNGEAKIREVGPNYPNSDLMEQWLLYENGGQLSADKAKEMLRDGTANGKKLTAKQKKYFGMVAANKAPNGGTKPDPNKPVIPKAGRPTTQDSLNLYNNARQVLDYYRGKGYSETPDIARDDLLQQMQQNAKDFDPNKKRTVPIKGGGSKEVAVPKSLYRQDISPTQFKQREYIDNILDTRSPMQLFDTRIKPTQNIKFENTNVNDPLYGDRVGIYGYDPELIKPAFLRGNKNAAVPGTARAPQPRPVPPPPELNPVDIQGIIPTGTPNVNPAPYRPTNVRPQPTNFSATYRDPSQPSGQQSLYFPNRQAWQGFLGTGALGNVDTRETANTASATGYRAMEAGGNVNGGAKVREVGANYPNTDMMEQWLLYKNGGVMYEDGGEVGTMWGGTADLESYNPYDGGTIEFNGQSHDNGGIGMHYNGSPIEVEGGEYASKDSQGNLNIYGNMYIPGTKTKFKAAAGAIMNKEKRYDFLKTKGSDLVNNSNPASRFDQLKFNAGQVMMDGGQMGMSDLASKKERLSNLQRDMLNMASFHGIDPFEMSKGKMKKAKGGASVPFMANGGSDPGGNDPTRADRNMNPGNIKYGEFAKKYGAKKDKDGFAIFKDRATGEKAMRDLLTGKNYSGLSVRQAISKWTDNQPYRYDLGPLTDKTVGDLNKDELDIVMSTMKQGEGTRYGVAPRPVPGTPRNTPTPNVPAPGPFTPYGLPTVQLDTPAPQINPVNPVPGYDYLETQPDKTLPSNAEPLALNNVLGEIYAAATNKVEPVPTQRYEPQLFTPYQVSFQDRLNANQSVFNAQSRAVGAGNPAALGTLGAQKYQADSAVMADEFRTNQAIANDITNKNIALVNDANLKNLGLADTQMTRQSQARSKTRELNQMILNSISDKYAKNNLENKRLAAYENLYDYRFVPTEDGGQKAQYMGPNAYFNYEGRNSGGQKPQDVRTISRYDAQGNLKGYADYDESDLREQQRLLDIEMKRRNLPLMPMQRLNK